MNVINPVPSGAPKTTNKFTTWIKSNPRWTTLIVGLILSLILGLGLGLGLPGSEKLSCHECLKKNCQPYYDITQQDDFIPCESPDNCKASVNVKNCACTGKCKVCKYNNEIDCSGSDQDELSLCDSVTCDSTATKVR